MFRRRMSSGGWVVFELAPVAGRAISAVRTSNPPVNCRINRCSIGHHHAGWRCEVNLAGAGVVLDSDPALEWQETMAKAAGLGRAMDLAEDIFSK